MSYILDALKKSEQERKQGEVPDLNSFPASSPSRSNKRRRLYLLGGTFVVLIVAINLWTLFARVPSPSAPAPTPVSAGEVDGEILAAAPDNPAAQTGDTAPASQAADAASGGGDVMPGQAEEAMPAGESVPTGDHLDPAGPTEIVDPSEPAPAPSTDQDDVDAEKDHFDEEFDEPPFEEPVDNSTRITVPYEDLPANVRNVLPELSIAAHYYSNTPSARMASINGRVMRQGQKIAEGLVLEVIDRDGVIFSFGKYRFSLKVFNP